MGYIMLPQGGRVVFKLLSSGVYLTLPRGGRAVFESLCAKDLTLPLGKHSPKVW